jgi:hypothetical protein
MPSTIKILVLQVLPEKAGAPTSKHIPVIGAFPVTISVRHAIPLAEATRFQGKGLTQPASRRWPCVLLQVASGSPTIRPPLLENSIIDRMRNIRRKIPALGEGAWLSKCPYQGGDHALIDEPRSKFVCYQIRVGDVKSKA